MSVPGPVLEAYLKIVLDFILLAGYVAHCFLGYVILRVRMYAFGNGVPVFFWVVTYAFEFAVLQQVHYLADNNQNFSNLG